jgi:hypothetical protein
VYGCNRGRRRRSMEGLVFKLRTSTKWGSTIEVWRMLYIGLEVVVLLAMQLMVLVEK